MGDIELIYYIGTTLGVVSVIFFLLRSNFIRNIFLTTNLTNNSKKDFYECGLRPISQYTPNFSIQYLILSVFFLLYDSELLFILPILTVFDNFNLYDIVLLLFYFGLLIISLVIDFKKNMLIWQI